MGFQSSSLVLLSALSMMALLCVAPCRATGPWPTRRSRGGSPKTAATFPGTAPAGSMSSSRQALPLEWCGVTWTPKAKAGPLSREILTTQRSPGRSPGAPTSTALGTCSRITGWATSTCPCSRGRTSIVVEDKFNNTRYAEFDIFNVEDEPSGYPLRLGRYSGDSEDYLTTYHSGLGGIHDNMKFSTTDKDQDQASGNCASSYGGWWYDKCQNVLLNGKGYIYWAGFCKSEECKSSLILVKPTDVCCVRQEEPILLGSRRR
ncbi:fibrinogen-like protein 1-like protein [Chrysemys picta bellii]|uniref:fibrinogen-like protein 1-like protein n=1 Tax=Chrysemys picta bellii TaxID=8478 RepID=UPI0032B2E998